MGKKGKVVFKEYCQEKIELLPVSYEEMIPEGHLVRVVNDSIDKLVINSLIEEFKGGGTSSYHPKMMLKVLAYSYTQKIYSSRQMAKALRENLYFRWLSGSNEPDFRTINRFRSTRLKGTINEVFASMIKMLHEMGVINLDNYFLDGTKIEANANKYSCVWKKSVDYNRTKLEKKIEDWLEQVSRIDEEEDRIYGDKDLPEIDHPEIDPKFLAEKIKEINEKLEKMKEDPEHKKKEELKELERKNKKAEKDYLERLKKYKDQGELFKGRNSYSKTDKDATFMRMKEDHGLKAQPKAAYNVQVGTENQFVVGYSIHQKPGDTTTLISHIEHIKTELGFRPKRVIADAGYGSQENFSYLEDEAIEAYVKYNSFYTEQKEGGFASDAYKAENMEYDQETDIYRCADGRELMYDHTEKDKTENGYLIEHKVYVCRDCKYCRHKKQCSKGKNSKLLRVNLELTAHRKKARQRLLSEEGIKLRKQRSIDTEPVFGHMKQNRGFRRFTLRGLDKVHIEFGLHSMAHNLIKLHIGSNTSKNASS